VIAGIAPDGPLALYLTLGMVAAVNPCGFAMLPAYLAYFLGLEGDDAAARVSVGTALRVAAAVAAGFLTAFAVAGLAVELTSWPIYESVPWISIAIGLALLALGLAMLVGFQLSVRLPRLDRGGRERTLGSMFVFGVSYAIASIGCTLPLFLGAVSGTMTRESVADGIVVFVIYALGMSLVLAGLTVAIALARTSLVRSLRRVQPYVGRVSGGLVALAGAYVAYYGWLELRLARASGGVVPSSAITDVVTGWSYHLTEWVDRIGSVRITVAVAAVLALVLAAAYGRRRPGRGHAGPAPRTGWDQDAQGASRSTRQPDGEVTSRR
jgi:cytochrome c biogenesis protein CcdA